VKRLKGKDESRSGISARANVNCAGMTLLSSWVQPNESKIEEESQAGKSRCRAFERARFAGR
jgi:hypothetical protein